MPFQYRRVGRGYQRVFRDVGDQSTIPGRVLTKRRKMPTASGV